jgi:hypothetical protein
MLACNERGEVRARGFQSMELAMVKLYLASDMAGELDLDRWLMGFQWRVGMVGSGI